jgi:hypothetical protein
MTSAPPGSLLAFLAEIPDPRSRHGRRHALVAMLAHACCAILRGCRGSAAIARWGRDRPIELRHRLGYRRRPASFGAFRALFARLPADAVEAAPARGADHLLGPRAGQALRAVALDGKLSRGSGTSDGPAVHLLAALGQETGCVPAQARVPAETDEHEAAPGLLKAMVLQGRVITGDAASCQRDLSRQVVDDGGHYLWEVDDDRPTLRADIATASGPSSSPLRPAAGGPRGRRGDDPGQARRPHRAAEAAGHHDAQ